jgi:hypothetical protein
VKSILIAAALVVAYPFVVALMMGGAFLTATLITARAIAGAFKL